MFFSFQKLLNLNPPVNVNADGLENLTPPMNVNVDDLENFTPSMNANVDDLENLTLLMNVNVDDPSRSSTFTFMGGIEFSSLSYKGIFTFTIY